MEKIQKLNFRALIVAGIVALIGTGPMVAFLSIGVIFYLIGADQGLGAYGSMTARDFLMFPVELLKMIFYEFFIIPGLIFLLSLSLYSKKKHILSIFLCVMVILSTAGIVFFQFYYKEIMSSQESKMVPYASSTCRDGEPVESPEAGLLVPTAKFAPDNFKRAWSVACTDHSITTEYRFEEAKRIDSSITYFEKTNLTFSEQTKKTAKGSVVYSFTFEGFPGEVVQLKYDHEDSFGHTSYLLSWNDHGKLVMIHAENVKKSQITPQTLAAMLKNLERVK